MAMTSEQERPSRSGADAVDLELTVDGALSACDGDPRAALRALVIANAHLQARLDQLEASLDRLARDISRGYVRDRYRLIERAGHLARAGDAAPE